MAPSSPGSPRAVWPSPPPRPQSTSPREQLNQGVYTVTYLLGVRGVNVDKLARLDDSRMLFRAIFITRTAD